VRERNSRRSSLANSRRACWSTSVLEFQRVPNHLPKGMHVFFESENGLVARPPEEGMAHPTLTDAVGRLVPTLHGASTFDSTRAIGYPRAIIANNIASKPTPPSAHLARS